MRMLIGTGYADRPVDRSTTCDIGDMGGFLPQLLYLLPSFSVSLSQRFGLSSNNTRLAARLMVTFLPSSPFIGR
jgi:hypothetical protein